MIIAQITDFHISLPGQRMDEMFRTSSFLEQAVAHLLSLEPSPDLVLATGDLVDKGVPEEYARLKDILNPIDAPLYFIPGNHDDRDEMRRAFSDLDYWSRDDEFLHYVIDEWPVRLIGLDTLIPGKISGELCEERLRWLSDRLAEDPEKPTLIFMHHPPIKSGMSAMDRHGFDAGGAEMGAIVERYRNIERIVCGHLHRPITARWHGTVLSVAPSTAHQMGLNMLEGGRQQVIMEPPACQLHIWGEETGLISHTSYTSEYEVPLTVKLS
tara:strand:+ start:76 stop:882 length:807 start_codon:yes stop_codon:yes gene_type:complete